MNITTLKALYNGLHRDLKIVPVLERCPPYRGSSKIGLFCLLLSYFWSVFCCIRIEYGDLVNLRIQFEYRKIRTRNNSAFGHFSCSERQTALRKYIRGYRVYMIICKSLVDESLHCMKEPTKWIRMLLLWFVLIHTVKKKWLAMCSGNLYDCIHVSVPAPLRFERLYNWETPQPWR